MATLGSLANLYTVWHARRLRQGALGEHGYAAMTQLERNRTLLALGLAVTTLTVVALELYERVFMHGTWL